MVRHLFEFLQRTAARFPESPAYTAPDLRMSYGEYLSAAQSAGACVARHAAQRQAVAVLMDARSAWCVPVLMGVLAAGCFYAPLDPNLPEERLRLILENLQPALIVADEKACGKAASACPDARVIRAEEALHAAPDAALLGARCDGIAPDDLAMVLYTSGSTGLPKGVAHTHRAMTVWTRTTVERYGIRRETVLANQSPWYYANSLLELFAPVYTGARVAMVPPSYLTFPKRLIRYLQEEHVTELCMTPSSFVAVANAGVLEAGILPEMTMFIMSGEVMPREPLVRWMQACPNARAMNFYGSTEALSVAVDDVVLPEGGGALPVGRLMPGVRLRLMREDGREARPGEVGEMYVSSPMMTVGYYRDEARTAALLVGDPLGLEAGKWLRTGDYGALDAQGNLTVAGRKDSMIKHRGYRMELGEVEAAVRGVPGCMEVCCLLRRETDEIWCFIAGDADEESVRRALKARLAKYMAPDRFVMLEQMPHNANMKIDRAALMRIMQEG